MSYYGNCDCGADLVPEIFEEQESVVENSRLIWKNRYRKAVSQLTCRRCLKNYCVDGSFDGQWYKKVQIRVDRVIS